MACAREAKNNEPFIHPQLVLTSRFSMIVSSLQSYGCDLPNTCAGRAGFALDEVMINATTTAKRLRRLQHGYCWVSLLCYITHISPLSCRIKHFEKKKKKRIYLGPTALPNLRCLLITRVHKRLKSARLTLWLEVCVTTLGFSASRVLGFLPAQSHEPGNRQNGTAAG